MNRADRSAATIRLASRIGVSMASCYAGVNDFCGGDNGEPQREERISTTATFAGSSHNLKGMTRKAQTGFTTDSRPLVMAMPVRGDPDCRGDGIQWALEGSVGTRGVVWRVGPDSCGSGHIILAPIHPGAPCPRPVRCLLMFAMRHGMPLRQRHSSSVKAHVDGSVRSQSDLVSEGN